MSDFPGPPPGEEGRPSVRPFGPRLFGLGTLGSPARAETLGASGKGGRQPSGRRRLLRRPREEWGPNPVLARARGAPQAPLLLGCVSRHPGVGLRETRDGFCHPLPETRPPSPPRRSLQDLRELVAGFPLLRSARIRLGRLKRCPALPRPGPFSFSLRDCGLLPLPPIPASSSASLTQVGVKSGFVFVHFCETSCRLF